MMMMMSNDTSRLLSLVESYPGTWLPISVQIHQSFPAESQTGFLVVGAARCANSSLLYSAESADCFRMHSSIIGYGTQFHHRLKVAHTKIQWWTIDCF